MSTLPSQIKEALVLAEQSYGNADTLHDALTSRNNGAQGAGLITEHMLQKTYVVVHVHEGVLMTKDLRYVTLMGQVRPRGHHAGVKHAMEFCLHNNAVVATLAAQVAGAKKVLIVDWVMFIVSSGYPYIDMKVDNSILITDAVYEAQSHILANKIHSINTNPSCPYQLGFHLDDGDTWLLFTYQTSNLA
nr:histone deacetylase 15 [Tanacetum cinerariifolium]